MTTKRKDIITTQIIEGCKAKDALCQKSLYELTVTKLYNVVYRIVLDRHKTQDVLQEVYINIFEKINQFDIQKGSIFNWINRIAINQSINFLRSNRLTFEDVNCLEIIEKEFTALQSLEAQYILDMLHQLPEQQRIIFNLHEIEGFSHEEIAALLHININSCRVYLSRAKTKLQELVSMHQHYIHTKSQS